MRKSTRLWSGQQREKFLKVLMLYVVPVLVQEILDWQILDSARSITGHAWIAVWFHFLLLILNSCRSISDSPLQVLIDESTQSTEPECLIPLVLGVKQVFSCFYNICVCVFVIFCYVWDAFWWHFLIRLFLLVIIANSGL